MSEPVAARETMAGRVHPCPSCGSRDVARILSGLPRFSDALEAERMSGEVVLGGCLVWVGQPSHRCHACDTSFLVEDEE